MVAFTELALARIRQRRAASETPDAAVRVRAMGGGCAGLMFELSFDAPRRDDEAWEADGVRIILDPKSGILLDGATIDYQEGLMGAGFTLKHPRAQTTCSCGKSFGL